MLDGIHGMLPREKMSAGVRKLRDFYDGKPGAPFVLKEFGFYSLDRWIKEGHIKSPEEIEGDYDAYLREVFGFDEPGQHDIWNLGWCEAEFARFLKKTIETEETTKLFRISPAGTRYSSKTDARFTLSIFQVQ